MVSRKQFRNQARTERKERLGRNSITGRFACYPGNKTKEKREKKKKGKKRERERREKKSKEKKVDKIVESAVVSNARRTPVAQGVGERTAVGEPMKGGNARRRCAVDSSRRAGQSERGRLPRRVLSIFRSVPSCPFHRSRVTRHPPSHLDRSLPIDASVPRRKSPPRRLVRGSRSREHVRAAPYPTVVLQLPGLKRAIRNRTTG